MLRLPQSSFFRLCSRFAGQCAVFFFTLFIFAKATLSLASIESVLEHANNLYAEKKFEDARDEFEHATELDKGSLPAWRGLGWSYWALGKKDRAYEIWSDLIKAFPNDTATLLALGKASEQDHRWNETINYYSEILKQQPHDLSARQGKARVFNAQEKYQAAEQEAKAALKEAPADINSRSLLVDALMGQGRYQEAESSLQVLAKSKPVPNNLHRLAKALAEQGKYEQAASQYRTSLVIQPDDDTLSAWRGLGHSLKKAGENRRAYAIWQDILKDYPNDVPTLLALGIASQQGEFWQQSLDYYARVLQIDPENATAHLGRAKIFYAQLDYKNAETEIQSILKLSPSNKEARLGLADILVATDRGEEAERILQSLADIDPNPKYLSRLGTISAGLSKDEESADYFRKTLQADPENLKAVLGLARSLWNQHRYEESTKLLQNYLTSYPDNDVVRARLAENASAASKWDLAEREYRFLVDKHPSDTRWKLKLARLLDMSGQHEESVQLAEQIVAKEPQNELAISLLANSAIFSGDIATGIRWTKQLTYIKATPERLNQLGRLHIELGDKLTKDNDNEAAMNHYFSASQAFQHAATLDPIKSRAPIGMVEALRLQKKYPEAVKLANQLHAQYPNSADIIQQFVNIYRDQGDYAQALEWLKLKKPLVSDHNYLEHNLAKLTFENGNKTAGLKMLSKVQAELQQPTVQALLYHGITVSKRQDTVPLPVFRDQMLALKKAGYQSVTMAQVLEFLDGKAKLPSKPILITFDDARTDSFQNADPILEEMGFTATMFVPVGDIATHGAYTANWSTLRKMLDTGRWDMQCHGTEAQHYIPVNAKGHTGRFMANKMWLANVNRLETAEEFTTRISQDLQNCRESIQRELPDSKIFAFAFPYSDQGHRSLSNAPDAFDINYQTVKKQFQLAFHVDNDYPLDKNTSRFGLPRFEVPRTFTGKDLIQKLNAINPVVSVPYDLALMEMNAGHSVRAMEIFEELERNGVINKADLLTSVGKNLSRSGDHAAARGLFEKANELLPNDPRIKQEIEALDRRLKPVVQMSGTYFEDNANRSYYSFGPSVQFPVSDRLSLAAYYKYLDFSQTLSSASSGFADDRSFQADGHQFEGQLSYELGANSSLSVSAGAADFSSHASSPSSKSGVTFPLGSVKLKTGVGDHLDLSIAADHTYVNTAGAIANGIAFSRVQGGLKVKFLESLSLSANHGYSYYTDHNQRNRTEVELNSRVWDDPDVTIGAQFVHDDMRQTNPLFWTPNNYLSFAAPMSLKKRWGQAVVTEFYVAPGMGKEAGSDFRFQINASGIVTWNLNEDINVYLSANRFEAATYSSFGAFAGGSIRF